jgi:FAD:protein FMN transferase
MSDTSNPPHRPERPAGGRTGDDVVVGIATPRGLAGLHRFTHQAMATVFEVFTLHPDRLYAAQAAQAAFELLDQLELELSRFIANSDITRINNLRAGQETRVGWATLECLAISRHVFELTGGAFDISLGTGLRSLEFDDAGVIATADGVRLDLGAVGKGYAVDRMAEVLEEWDIGPTLVHGGFSSLLALDPPAGHPGWPLTISDPLEPSRVLERLSVRQTALGASGLQKGDHIRDPRTGGPVRGRIAAWASVERPARTSLTAEGMAPRMAAAAVADAVTTAFMLMAPADIEALCGASPGLEVWILPAGDAPERQLLHFGTPTP